MSLKLGSQLFTLVLVLFLIFAFKDFLNKNIIEEDTITRKALNAALNGELNTTPKQNSLDRTATIKEE